MNSKCNYVDRKYNVTCGGKGHFLRHHMQVEAETLNRTGGSPGRGQPRTSDRGATGQPRGAPQPPKGTTNTRGPRVPGARGATGSRTPRADDRPAWRRQRALPAEPPRSIARSGSRPGLLRIAPDPRRRPGAPQGTDVRPGPRERRRYTERRDRLQYRGDIVQCGGHRGDVATGMSPDGTA